jgi:hypothetical protein
MSDPHLLVNDTLEYAKAQYEMNYTQKMMGPSDLFDNSLYDKVAIVKKEI